MSQSEFELYLKLLGDLLDLRPEQREEIRDELRDHLEERLAELSELGVPREEAVERALREFGDAAGLAGSFTRLAREQRSKRRRRMYRNTGSALAVTMLLLSAVAFWPHGDEQDSIAPRRAGAQGVAGGDPAGGNGAAVGRGAAGGLRAAGPDVIRESDGRSDPGSELRTKVEAALDGLVAVDFDDIPFSTAAKAVGLEIEVDVLFDKSFLDEVGVEADTAVSLSLGAKIPARVAFDLMIDQLGDGDVGYVAREGFVYITSMSETLQLEVYDVRDLVGREHSRPRPQAAPAGFGGGGGGGGFGAGGLGGGEGDGFDAGGGPGMMGSRAMAGAGRSAPARSRSRDDVDSLLEVIVTNTAHDTWAEVGGGGSISAFDGLLVVRNSPKAHREVRQLLAMLRAADGGRVRPSPAAEPSTTRRRPVGRASN